jgi:hypothetical protein
VSTDVILDRRDREPQWRRAVGTLGRKEAWRILTSPAFPLLLGYLVLVTGIDPDESAPMFRREAIAELLAYISLVFLGPMAFLCSHLVASSARRSGSERLLAATLLGQRRRDLGLCLGVLLGPVAAALAVAGASAWLAGDGMPVEFDPTALARWSWIDVAQVPAIVLGAGILGVVVARWMRFPGSLLLGVLVMVIGTGWLLSGADASAIRPWFAPYVAIAWWTDSTWAVSGGSQVWHLAYLFALSGLGVCAVALRQHERRARWLVAGTVALAAVVTTGVLQLPSSAFGR